MRIALRVAPHQFSAAVDGDPVALDQVVAAWLPQVYAWCNRLGAGRIEPEEAAHDVMMLFVRRIDTVDGVDRVAAWLFGACRRVVANHRRRVWWRRWLPGIALELRASPGSTGDRLDARELAAGIADALDRLSADHREVLVLCYLEDRSIPEAAELLGVPAGTVKSRLFAARAKFQAAYPEEDR